MASNEAQEVSEIDGNFLRAQEWVCASCGFVRLLMSG
ncbi:hypothetical protein ANTHELSMS3_04633 (plasmid) [Antarctobacter heliothermus]|uniref:Uncharacterized protein n=1 Tax=Antarctobacter heliothermus TaxID=74033 RepID=A0A222EC57_9RHOB|nr:hypothetical protein ANTHELSMS3_04633 [Antarctobacter heliothermus]